MVNPKFQHHAPFLLTTKVTLKLAALCRLHHLHHWQRSIHLLPPLSNEHITLRRKTQHLWNPHDKMWTYYFYHYFSRSYFHPPISTKLSQAYASWDGSNTPPLLVYLGEWIVKYSFVITPLPKIIVFGIKRHLCDICSLVHYCTEGNVQRLSSKILLLPRHQQIYAFYVVLIST